MRSVCKKCSIKSQVKRCSPGNCRNSDYNEGAETRQDYMFKTKDTATTCDNPSCQIVRKFKPDLSDSDSSDDYHEKNRNQIKTARCICEQANTMKYSKSKKRVCKECVRKSQVKISPSTKRSEGSGWTSNPRRAYRARSRQKDKLLLDAGTSCDSPHNCLIARELTSNSSESSTHGSRSPRYPENQHFKCICQRSYDNLQFKSEYSNSVLNKKKYRSTSCGICIPCNRTVSTQQNYDECVDDCPFRRNRSTNTKPCTPSTCPKLNRNKNTDNLEKMIDFKPCKCESNKKMPCNLRTCPRLAGRLESGSVISSCDSICVKFKPAGGDISSLDKSAVDSAQLQEVETPADEIESIPTNGLESVISTCEPTCSEYHPCGGDASSIDEHPTDSQQLLTNETTENDMTTTALKEECSSKTSQGSSLPCSPDTCWYHTADELESLISSALIPPLQGLSSKDTIDDIIKSITSFDTALSQRPSAGSRGKQVSSKSSSRKGSTSSEHESKKSMTSEEAKLAAGRGSKQSMTSEEAKLIACRGSNQSMTSEEAKLLACRGSKQSMTSELAQLLAACGKSEKSMTSEEAKLLAAGRGSKKSMTSEEAKLLAAGRGSKQQSMTSEEAKLLAASRGSKKSMTSEEAKLLAAGRGSKQQSMTSEEAKLLASRGSKRSMTSEEAKLLAAGRGSKKSMTSEEAKLLAAGRGSKQSMTSEETKLLARRGSKRSMTSEEAKLLAARGSKRSITSEEAKLIAARGSKRSMTSEEAKLIAARGSKRSMTSEEAKLIAARGSKRSMTSEEAKLITTRGSKQSMTSEEARLAAAHGSKHSTTSEKTKSIFGRGSKESITAFRDGSYSRTHSRDVDDSIKDGKQQYAADFAHAGDVKMRMTPSGRFVPMLTSQTGLEQQGKGESGIFKDRDTIKGISEPGVDTKSSTLLQTHDLSRAGDRMPPGTTGGDLRVDAYGRAISPSRELDSFGQLLTQGPHPGRQPGQSDSRTTTGREHGDAAGGRPGDKHMLKEGRKSSDFSTTLNLGTKKKDEDQLGVHPSTKYDDSGLSKPHTLADDELYRGSAQQGQNPLCRCKKCKMTKCGCGRAADLSTPHPVGCRCNKCNKSICKCEDHVGDGIKPPRQLDCKCTSTCDEDVGKHPENCDCVDCLCDPSKFRESKGRKGREGGESREFQVRKGRQSREDRFEMGEGQDERGMRDVQTGRDWEKGRPGREASELGKGHKAKRGEWQEDERHPENCDCIECICAPSSEKGSATIRQAKKLLHPPDCDCVDCICEPCIIRLCKLKTSFQCPTLKPIEKKPHPDCKCVMCICPECLHVPDCQCNPCKCKRCADEKIARSRIKCTCPDCVCNPCGDMAQREKQHSNACTCSQCICSPCEDMKIEKQKNQTDHIPRCACNFCMCKECPDPRIKGAINTPSLFKSFGQIQNCNEITPLVYEIPHGPNCKCVKCTCQMCEEPKKNVGLLTHGPDCLCSTCFCNPCKPTQPDQYPTVILNKKECSCDKCVCNPCDDPIFQTRKTKENMKKAGQAHGTGCQCPLCFVDTGTKKNPQNHGEGCICHLCKNNSYPESHHGPNCKCPKCICEVCVNDKDVPKAQSDHGPNCKCPKCTCSPCENDEQKKLSQHGSNCKCPKCVCDSCDKDEPEKQSKHGSNCKCPKCLVDPCDKDKPEKLSNHGPNCKCPKCVCDPCVKDESKKQSKHGPNCKCAKCLCDPCDKDEPEKQSNHGPNCKCPKCVCDPCDKDESEKQSKHGPNCKCAKCLCDPCDKDEPEKQSNHGPNCKCPKCVCDPCDKDEPEKQSKHGPNCNCAKCLCDPCYQDEPEKQSIHGQNCKCPKCVCDPCDNDEPEKLSKHGSNCKCEKCNCGPCDNDGTVKPSQHGPNCECPTCMYDPSDKCGFGKQSEHAEKEIQHGSDCKCRKCSCFPCHKMNTANKEPRLLDQKKKENETSKETNYEFYSKSTQCVCEKKNLKTSKVSKLNRQKEIDEIESLLVQIRSVCKDTAAQSSRLTDIESTFGKKGFIAPCMTEGDVLALLSNICDHGQPNSQKLAVSCNEKGISTNSQVCIRNEPHEAPAPPIKITQVSRISEESVLVKWTQPLNSSVTGYEVTVDDAIKSKVHSCQRTSTVIFGMQFKKRAHIAVHTITQSGRFGTPALIVYEL